MKIQRRKPVKASMKSDLANAKVKYNADFNEGPYAAFQSNDGKAWVVHRFTGDKVYPDGVENDFRTAHKYAKKYNVQNEYENNQNLDMYSLPQVRVNFKDDAEFYAIGDNGKQYKSSYDAKRKVMYFAIPEDVEVVGYIPIESSCNKPAPKRAIKASENIPVVMYFNGKQVFEGDITDIYGTIVDLCQDEATNQFFMNYLNQFGDPFDFDGTPEDTAYTFAWWVGQDYDEAMFGEEDFYVEYGEDGIQMELFPKSDEAVEGSVQRRAKKSVKASNTKRGGNFMKLKRKNAITCTGDDYKVKMLRQFLDKMNLNSDTWDYVQVKCNGKAINLDEGAVNLLIDYYTNVYDPKKDAYSSEYVGASNRPAPRRRSVKASTYGDAFETIERSKDAYIQRWSEEYEGTPATSWDNIFDNVLEEFTRYADDESSGFILEKFENGEYTADDMDNEFEQYIMWRDLGEYDQD